MAECLIVFLMLYLEYLWCRCSIRQMNRKKGSDADGCDSPGSFTSPSLLWLVDCSPESLWASWEAWMSVSDLDFTCWYATVQLAEVWLLDVSSVLDLPQVFRTEMKLADVTVALKMVCSVTAIFFPLPAPSFIASPFIIRKLAWQTILFCQALTGTDCFLPAMIDFLH